VIVPKRNEKDLPDIPEEVRKTIKFHFVSTIDEVLKLALGPQKGNASQKRKAFAQPPG